VLQIKRLITDTIKTLCFMTNKVTTFQNTSADCQSDCQQKISENQFFQKWWAATQKQAADCETANNNYSKWF